MHHLQNFIQLLIYLLHAFNESVSMIRTMIVYTIALFLDVGTIGTCSAIKMNLRYENLHSLFVLRLCAAH